MGTDVDEELNALVASGAALIVATRSAALDPHVTRACGARVSGKGRVRVLLPRPTSAQTIRNLEDNAQIALCVSSPRDYRTFQLKGRCLGLAPSTPDDLLLSERQLRAFGDGVAQFGHTRAQVRNLWCFDLVAVDVEVTSVYAQTPGPGAGARVKAELGV